MVVGLTQLRSEVSLGPMDPIPGGHLDVLEQIFVDPAEDVALLEPDELGGALALRPEEDAARAVLLLKLIILVNAAAAIIAVIIVAILAVAYPPVRGGAETEANAVVKHAVLVATGRGAVLGVAVHAPEQVFARPVAQIAQPVRAIVGLAVARLLGREYRPCVDRAPVE